MAFWGSLIWGKAYMAPCTVLQLMPGMELKVSVTILAFSASCPSTISCSCTHMEMIDQLPRSPGDIVNLPFFSSKAHQELSVWRQGAGKRQAVSSYSNNLLSEHTSGSKLASVLMITFTQCCPPLLSRLTTLLSRVVLSVNSRWSTMVHSNKSNMTTPTISLHLHSASANHHRGSIKCINTQFTKAVCCQNHSTLTQSTIRYRPQSCSQQQSWKIRDARQNGVHVRLQKTFLNLT